jgi:hypothetical protein
MRYLTVEEIGRERSKWKNEFGMEEGVDEKKLVVKAADKSGCAVERPAT